MAATLQARVGDTVTLVPRPGAPPQRYKVSGVALITAPDQVFQPLNPLLGPAPAQPPENAVIMQTGTFQRTLGRALPPITAVERDRQLPARRPEGGPVAGAGAARPRPRSAPAARPRR